MTTGMTTTLALALIAGSLCASQTRAGDLTGSGLRQPLGSSSLRPSLTRPSMMQELGVPSAPAPAASQSYGAYPSTGGAATTTGGGSYGGTYSATGAGGGFVPPGAASYGAGAASAGAGMDASAVARRAMGLNPAGGDAAAIPLPAGAEQGLVVRRAMGVNDVPGAASPDGELAPGVGAGDVVRKAMGIDTSGGAPLPGRARNAGDASPGAAAANGDSGPDLVELSRPRQRATIPAYGRRPPPDKSFSVDWEYLRSALRGGITNLLVWAGAY